MAADDAALLAAAVRAAILAKAPRRTVAALAAAVTCALRRGSERGAARAGTETGTRAPAGTERSAEPTPLDGASLEVLGAALRTARRARRQRRRERQRAAMGGGTAAPGAAAAEAETAAPPAPAARDAQDEQLATPTRSPARGEPRPAVAELEPVRSDALLASPTGRRAQKPKQLLSGCAALRELTSFASLQDSDACSPRSAGWASPRLAREGCPGQRIGRVPSPPSWAIGRSSASASPPPPGASGRPSPYGRHSARSSLPSAWTVSSAFGPGSPGSARTVDSAYPPGFRRVEEG